MNPRNPWKGMREASVSRQGTLFFVVIYCPTSSRSSSSALEGEERGREAVAPG